MDNPNSWVKLFLLGAIGTLVPLLTNAAFALPAPACLTQSLKFPSKQSLEGAHRC